VANIIDLDPQEDDNTTQSETGEDVEKDADELQIVDVVEEQPQDQEAKKKKNIKNFVYNMFEKYNIFWE